MKYSKNAEYAYKSNLISAENGWIKWYDKEKIRKKIRLAGTYSQFVILAAVLGVSRLFAEEIKAFGILRIIGLLVLNAIILLAAVAPMREILHLIPVSKGRLDGKCIMSFRNHFSVYNGSVNRGQILISLALPLIVFSSVFGISAVATSGVLRFFALFMLAESVYMCYADVYMFFFCIKNIGKTETVFGEYKKV